MRLHYIQHCYVPVTNKSVPFVSIHIVRVLNNILMDKYYIQAYMYNTQVRIIRHANSRNPENVNTSTISFNKRCTAVARALGAMLATHQKHREQITRNRRFYRFRTQKNRIIYYYLRRVCVRSFQSPRLSCTRPYKCILIIIICTYAYIRGAPTRAHKIIAS